MFKYEALHKLRTLLARLFDDGVSIRVIVADAGMDTAAINFNAAADRIWHDVLEVAHRQGKVGQVIAITSALYPEQDHVLAKAYQDYLHAWRNPPSLHFWLGLVLAIVLGAAGIWRFAFYIEPMSNSGRYNIAVAQLPILDSEGRQVSNCVSKKISEWIYQTVLDDPDPAQQELLTDSRSPAQIGVIIDRADREKEQQKVGELAERIRATILIHGVITTTGEVYRLQPTFYIRRADSSFTFASELTGPNRLGAPIDFKLPPNTTCTNLNLDELRNLNRALADRIEGLRYIVSGLRHLYAGQFELAYARFAQSTHLEYWRPTDKGQEVVWLLMGTTKLRAYEPEGESEKAQNDLKMAHIAFTQAITINPDYSRGYLGLGLVTLEESQIYSHSLIIDVKPAKLDEAYRLFIRSLQATDQPKEAYIPVKATFNQGKVQLLGFEHYMPGWSGKKAYEQFKTVIDAYEANHSPLLIELAAHAHANLGKLAGHNHDWQAMSDHYHQAINLLSQPSIIRDGQWIARYWTHIALADKKRGDLCQALNDYEQAFAFGSGVISQQELADWQRQFEQLKNDAKGAACGKL